MEIERKVRVVNSAGLHARPCHAIVSLALEFESELWIALEGNEVNGKSILSLMTLNASCNTELCLRASGEDADDLICALAGLFQRGFEERS